MNYVTTNIRFPQDLYFQLKQEAARKRKSLAAVVRERITGRTADQDKASWQKKSLQLDTIASSLGRKLKHFDAVAVIRTMREE